MNQTNKDKTTIGYKGKKYEIDIPARDLRDAPHQDNKWHLKQLEYCISRKDYVTLENRIANGLKFEWLWELDDNGNRVNMDGGDMNAGTVEQDQQDAI